MRKIELEKTLNTRDFEGSITKDGHVIKGHKLIRSGHLHNLSLKDIETLKENELSIVIDFRSQKEFVNKADVKIENVTYYNFPALKGNLDNKNSKNKNTDSNLLRLVNKDNGGKDFMLKTYKELITSKEAIEAYKNFFKVLESCHDGAILFHCSQGKDRAGLAAFYVSYALGISLEDCISDYLLTNVAMETKIKQLTPLLLKESNNDYSLLPSLAEVFSAKMEYIQIAIDTIAQNYQSIDNYLINVLEVDTEKLKKLYLK